MGVWAFCKIKSESDDSGQPDSLSEGKPTKSKCMLNKVYVETVPARHKTVERDWLVSQKAWRSCKLYKSSLSRFRVLFSKKNKVDITSFIFMSIRILLSRKEEKRVETNLQNVITKTVLSLDLSPRSLRHSTNSQARSSRALKLRVYRGCFTEQK